MGSKKLFSDFASAINSIKNKACWDVVFSERTDTALLFELGAKKAIKQKIIKSLNRNLLSEEYAYEGEFSLFVKCYWEIYSNSKESCNSDVFDFQKPVMFECVNNLKDTTINEVKINMENFNLSINFSNGTSINILTSIQEWNNYSIKTPKGRFIIDHKLNLKFEE